MQQENRDNIKSKYESLMSMSFSELDVASPKVLYELKPLSSCNNYKPAIRARSSAGTGK